MAKDNTVILRVELDEAGTEKKLQQLVLDIEATKKAQAALTAERKAGAVSDADFAKRSVDLQTQLKGQRTETTALTKNLELYRAAQNGEADSYKATQAALSLAIRQQQELAGSAGDTTEASQALTKQIAAYRDMLGETDAKQGAFFRNIGNYPKGESLAPLVQQLVKLEEAMKSGTLTAEQAAAADRDAIGYKQRIAQAGAIEGRSYEETTALVKSYGDAIRPATAELVKLEIEQQQVAKSGKATGEEVAQIGFRFGQAQKQIQHATEALKEVPAQTEPIQGLGNTIAELDNTTGAFGGQVANLKQRFATAKQGIDLAKGGFTGLKGAIASTGIGLLILALGALYEYFTKTDEGAEDLAAGLAFLKGGFSVLESVAIGLGKGLIKLFTDPKASAQDLLSFIEDQVVNRVKAIGVIFNALKSGNFKEATNGVLQYATGVENVIGKTKVFAEEAKRAADAAYGISRANDALEDSERASLTTLAENKNLIDKLVLTSKDRTLTEQQRLANLDKAGTLEKANLQTTIAQATERLRIAKLENDEAERSGKTSDELRDKVAQAQAAVINLAGESATLQQSIQNRRSALLQQEAADEKAAAQKAKQLADQATEARLQARRDALALESQLLTRQLTQVQANSDEELNILQRRLRNGYQAELTVKNLTVSAKKVIDAKYENDSLTLSLDFNRRRLLAALQAEMDLTGARLAEQQSGSAEALRLQAEQIEQQRQLALAGLAANTDNTAKAAAINAAAANQQRQAEYANATRLLADYIEGKRNAVELDYAKGLIQEGEYQRRLAAVAEAGTKAQAVINDDYRQSNAENAKQATQLEIEAARRHTAEVKQTEEAKQQIREATVQGFAAGTDAIIQLFGEESGAGQAALALKKVFALAEIGINLQRQLSLNAVAAANLATIPLIGPALSAAYLVTNNALAIAQAAVGAATVLAFEQGGLARVDGGGVAQGPSHAHGGIPLYYRGRPAGIEIEGDEPVLTANVSRNPLLLSLASTVNQLAGGRPLVANFPIPRMAAGGISQVAAFDQMRGSAPVIDYERMGAATAKALRKSPPITRVSDIKSGLERDNFTQEQSNG
jgi:hypothetical protein